MPLLQVPGYGVETLEKAIADAEADRMKVVQVGHMAGTWWLLVERPAAAARKRAATKETRA